MAATFTRTNAYQVPSPSGSILLITGTVTVTSADTEITPAILGVKRVISFLGSTVDGSDAAWQPFNHTGTSFTLIDMSDGTTVDAWPVNVYTNVSFLAV